MNFNSSILVVVILTALLSGLLYNASINQKKRELGYIKTVTVNNLTYDVKSYSINKDGCYILDTWYVDDNIIIEVCPK